MQILTKFSWIPYPWSDESVSFRFHNFRPDLGNYDGLSLTFYKHTVTSSKLISGGYERAPGFLEPSGLGTNLYPLEPARPQEKKKSDFFKVCF